MCFFKVLLLLVEVVKNGFVLEVIILDAHLDFKNIKSKYADKNLKSVFLEKLLIFNECHFDFVAGAEVNTSVRVLIVNISLCFS